MGGNPLARTQGSQNGGGYIPPGANQGGMTGINNPGAYTGAPVSGSSPGGGANMVDLFGNGLNRGQAPAQYAPNANPMLAAYAQSNPQYYQDPNSSYTFADQTEQLRRMYGF
jgi:hypothetical protein